MCVRTQFPDKIPHGEISLEDFKNWVPAELLSRLETIIICGNFGDSVIAKDTAEIFEYIRTINKNVFILLHTNGSARTSDFWIRLAKAKVAVSFSIDGLEDTYPLYRVGLNWNTTINNAKIFIAAGGDARWQMVAFEHNEHQVDACKKMSEELGFHRFTRKDSNRFKELTGFNVHNKFGDYELKPTKRGIITSTTRNFLSDLNNSFPISCECTDLNRIFIGADGILSSCCEIETEKIFDVQLQKYNDLVANIPSLHTHSIK